MTDSAEHRRQWEASSRPGVIFDSGLSPDQLGALRRSFESARPLRSWKPSRHRCLTAALTNEPIVALLRTLASEISGADLRVASMSARCYEPGDYALLADDDDDDDDEDAVSVELCLDFSEHARAASGAVYCADRRPYLAMPQQPGSAALILRRADTRRRMPYLKQFTDQPSPCVHLLTLQLDQV